MLLTAEFVNKIIWKKVRTKNTVESSWVPKLKGW